jgi:hypothetical protein
MAKKRPPKDGAVDATATSTAQAPGTQPDRVYAPHALFDLVHEGMVELVHNRGFRVVGLSEHDLDEIYELRLMLEAPAIRHATGRISPRCGRFEEGPPSDV